MRLGLLFATPQENLLGHVDSPGFTARYLFTWRMSQKLQGPLDGETVDAGVKDTHDNHMGGPRIISFVEVDVLLPCIMGFVTIGILPCC